MVVCTLAVSTVASACSSSSHASKAKAAAQAALAVLPSDYFTAAAHKPLDLVVVSARKGVVTESIGSAGGMLTTKGADGTTFTLVVPPKALPMDTPITMTPYARIEGLPGAAKTARQIGVALYPEGLQLAVPGTLTIAPRGPVPVTVATLGSQADGKDAGLVMHQRKGSTISISIPHFSGWVATYPTDDG
ncbi:MAG TPA: hypothetical protein VL119_01565, partial [Acidimicrobiia bacterium]|nr:hypothetical protein [Acidimicrobiia bacterium]